MNLLISKTLILSASLWIAGQSAHAGTLTIKNENDSTLNFQVIPKGASRNKIFKRTVAGDNESQLQVSAADLNGQSYYSLQGETNPFMGDTCGHLNVNKNYTIIFITEPMGMTCVAINK